MLPDFPEEKSKLMAEWTKYLERKQNAGLGPFSSPRYFTHHEGNRWRIERSDGTVSESEYEELKGELIVSNEEATTLTPEQIAAKLDDIAANMAAQATASIFATLKDASDEAGNSINANGKPFSKELFLELLSRISIDFDSDGKPQMPTMIVPPGFNKSLLDEWDKDPELAQKHDEIMKRKKEEFDAREASRKLVD